MQTNPTQNRVRRDDDDEGHASTAAPSRSRMVAAAASTSSPPPPHQPTNRAPPPTITIDGTTHARRGGCTKSRTQAQLTTQSVSSLLVLFTHTGSTRKCYGGLSFSLNTSSTDESFTRTERDGGGLRDGRSSSSTVGDRKGVVRKR